MFLHSLLNEIHFSIYQGKFEFDGMAVLHYLNIQYWVIYIEKAWLFNKKLKFSKVQTVLLLKSLLKPDIFRH